VELAFVLWIVFVVLEHHLPFRGLFSEEMTDAIKQVGFRHYVLAWLPTWWMTLAISFTAVGVSTGCAIWAFVAEVNNEPAGLPLLIGISSLVTAVLTGITPIVLAWLKERSETRQLEHFRERIQQLESQVERNREGHAENAVNIQKVTVATQKIAEAAEKIVEAKEQAKAAYDAVMEKKPVKSNSEENDG
jgi:hypothetical protein